MQSASVTVPHKHSSLGPAIGACPKDRLAPSLPMLPHIRFDEPENMITLEKDRSDGRGVIPLHPGTWVPSKSGMADL